MVEEYPRNSHNQRPGSGSSQAPPAKKAPAKKQVTQITTTPAVQRKRSIVKRLKENFFGGNLKNAWTHMALDVLVPATKDMIVDAGIRGVETLVLGEARNRGPRVGRGNGAGWSPYSSMSRSQSGPGWRSQNNDQRREVSNRARTLHDFDEIILNSRGEAEQVLDTLAEIIATYEVASVADLYSLVGITPAYTDPSFGWSNLREASVQMTRGGVYLLNLPKPEPLD